MATRTVAKTIWLHIGIPKTGTTTIQTLFIRNRAPLAQAGVLYPKTGIFDGTRSHIGLMHYAAMGGDAAPDKRAIELTDAEAETYRESLMPSMRKEIEASGCSQVFVSSEHIAPGLRRQGSASQLVSGLRQLADEVRVLVYLRPQHELYSSLFSTQLKSGRTAPPQAPIQATNPFYNYDLLLKRWELAEGVGRITVRLFRPSLFKNNNFIDDFFDAMEMPTPAGLKLERSVLNSSLDASTAEFLRIVNVLQKDTDATGKSRRALVKSLEQISAKKSSTVPRDVLEHMDQVFRPSNALVAGRWFPELTGPLFPPLAAASTDQASPLTVTQAVEIAARLWEIRTEQLNEALRRGDAAGPKGRPASRPADSAVAAD